MGLGERAFKKAINTRAHRERAQPAKRAKLGLLEKHKDYVQRARDYHRKQDALKALRTRAANRNPDEFHFGMIKSRMINGRHSQNHVERLKSIPADMLKLMKTQDVAYISLQQNANRKKLKEAREQVALAEARRSGPAVRTHTLFAEDEEEREQQVQQLRTTLARSIATNTSDNSESPHAALDPLDALDALAEPATPQDRELGRCRAMLQAREQRQQHLDKLEHKLRLDRQLLQKGRRTKVGTDEYGFAKYKWAVERKK